MQNEEFKRVLIVEDDLSLKPVWHELFSDMPTQVYWAVSYEESIKIIEQMKRRREAFDLIITDIFLAGSGTGIELIASDQVKDSQAKTILISVADKDEILNEYGHILPNAHVMSKPISIRHYKKVIGGMLFNE